ncbi:TRAM domain-containing protein [Caloramator sp. Dgby_cultured_2]
MNIHIIKDGKEAGQGVAYLDDGTMIVVEGGKKYVGEVVDVVVTSVLQTAAGRMIFAKLKNAS